MADSGTDDGWDNDGDDAVDAWATWRSMPLGRRVSGSLVGGAAAAGATCAIDISLFNGSGWSLGRFVFIAMWWAVMFPVLLWIGARRRSAG